MASKNATHLPVDTTKAVPAKSILKKHHSHDCSSHSSVDCPDPEGHDRRAQWDEMNILATYHPADKDYGHMKIDDPPTPYHEYQEPVDDSVEKMDLTDMNASGGSTGSGGLRERKASFSDTRVEVLDEDTIAKKLTKQDSEDRIRKIPVTSDEEDESQLTEEQRKKKQDFKNRRKLHYNEFQVSESMSNLTIVCIAY